MIKTLIVEDEAFVALDLQEILTRLGHDVIGITATAEEALYIVQDNLPDLILVDVSLAGTFNGVEMVQQIRRTHDMPVIYITAYSDNATIELMKDTEPFEYMLKPFNEQVLRVTIELALHKAAVRREQLASERLLATTLHSIGDAVITTDQIGHVHFLNPVAEALTGWTDEEANGRPIGSVFHIINEQTRVPAFDPVKAVLETGKSSTLANHTLLISKDGSEYPIEDSAAPIMNDDKIVHGVVLVFRDVTQRQQSEQWLRQAQKLDSLGLLAGGIAHDFNNIIGTIMINISMLRQQALSPSQSLPIIERIERASQQAAGLTGQLLSYAGGNPLKIETIDLNEIIDSALDLVGPNQPDDLSVEKELWQTPLPILSERSQMQQVLLNLILNAYDAMREEADGGTLALRSAYQFMDTASLSKYSSKNALKEGDYALLSIEDTGCGIETAVLEQVFDPFFSTKPTGSGLGLAATLGIINQCEGGIMVESQVDVGSTFTVIFPSVVESTSIGHRRSGALDKDGSEDRNEDRNEDTHRNNENNGSPVGKQPDWDEGETLVLIVDDQPDILNALNDILTVEGYQTLLASDGIEAVELYQIYSDQIELVIIDIRMPVMNGTDALIAMHEHNPELRAILMTGYADVATLSSYQRSLANVPVLQKPFSYEQIVEQVQRQLTPAM